MIRVWEEGNLLFTKNGIGGDMSRARRRQAETVMALDAVITFVVLLALFMVGVVLASRYLLMPFIEQVSR